MFTRYLVVAAVAIGLTIVACQPPAQEAGALSDEDVAAIREKTNVFVQAALANDWAAAAEIYSEDVVLMLPGAPVMEGRATWQAWVASFNLTVTQYSNEIQEIDGRADLAFVRGSFSESLMFEGAPEPVSDTGKYLQIWRRGPDGTWLVTLEIWNLDEPAVEAGSEGQR
jgi:ketosteroid isomerase-like protein